MATRSRPSRWPASRRSAISVLTRPLGPVAAAGRSSVSGPSWGPYRYRLSARTSLAPAAAAPSAIASVRGGKAAGQSV